MLNGDRHLEVGLFGFDVQGLVVEHRSALVEVLHVIGNASLVTEHVLFARAAVEGNAQVFERNGYAAVEICYLAHALRDGVVTEFFVAEHAFVGLEGDRGALVLGLAY